MGKRIMLSGYFGFDNAGDEAICSAIIQTLREKDDSLEFIVLSGNPEKTKKQYAVAAIPRMDLKQIYQALKKTDLFISGGGSLLQDKTGNLTIPYYLTMIHLAKWAKVPVAIYAQGIGPVERPFFKRWIGKLFRKLDYISVRDQDSRQLLIDWKVPASHVEEVVDPVFLLPTSGEAVGKELLQKESIHFSKSPILFSVRRWKGNDQDFEVFAALCDRLVERGEEILFVPFHYPEDIDASIEVVSRMHRSASVLQQNYTPTELMDIVANGKIMIGMRLHALIFAAARNLPCVGISYDPKIDSFLQQMGQEPAGVSGEVKLEVLEQAVLEVLQGNVLPQQEVLKLGNQLREKAMRPAEQVLQLLNK